MDLEDQQVETTRFEKVLAVVLVIFLLVGGFWVLEKLERIPDRPDWEQARWQLGIPSLEENVAGIRREVNLAEQLAQKTQQARAEAQTEYEFRREEYRTALDAGIESASKQQAYEEARLILEERTAEYHAAQTLLDKKRQALQEPQQKLQQKQQDLAERMRAKQRRYDLLLFGLRFGYAVPVFALTVYAWQRLRLNGSHYLIIGTSFVAAAGIQLAYLAGRYAWGLFKDFAPLFISVTGAVISIAGIVALRRYLFSFERVSQARLRQGRCPYCGFPNDRTDAYCANCGEELLTTCPECGEPRPRLAPYCPHCGAEQV